jgi:hypothetical protein
MGVGALTATTLGLAKPTPKIAKNTWHRRGMYALESANQLYMWNTLEGVVYTIARPASLASSKNKKTKDIELQHYVPPASTAWHRGDGLLT